MEIRSEIRAGILLKNRFRLWSLRILTSIMFSGSFYAHLVSQETVTFLMQAKIDTNGVLGTRALCQEIPRV